uniref:oxaloacetate decarboxylase (Na(+) extruding) n=1 Tax=Candidatus Kentrum sp. SD TaxID=2126332 RepID=A0A451BL04_9GAMM|nr:MAG: oxaloacetate decarboxylase, beta subunit [Candidatus Kentron sp. SD]
MYQTVLDFFHQSGFGQFQWGNGVMILIGFLFIYLAIAKRFEPLLLVPIGFGILVGNIPYDTRSLSLGVYDGPTSEADLHYYKVAGFNDLIEGKQGSIIPLPAESIIPYHNTQEGKLAVENKEAIIVDNHTKLAYSGEIEVPSIVDVGQGRYIFVEKPAADNRYPVIIQPENQDVRNAGFFYLIFQGVALGIFPPLIFLGVGALTDFGPMLSNPRTLLLGASAQIGIFGALLGALLIGFDIKEAASIGIIGGADGPTSIFVCTALAPDLLGAVALAAYSYMAMVPIIQPPIMKLLTTKEERLIRMDPPTDVSRRTRIMFPVLGFLLTAFITPAALPLLGMLFFGNLLRESLVTDRLSKTAQNALIDIVTIMLGISVGAKTQAATFLTWQTIGIFAMGIVAFIIATACGLLLAKFLNKISDKPINPLIGAAGVSAVPMAARVVHNVGQKEDPHNFLLMHAMGPNVAGVIGSAVAAGVLLSALG